MLHPERRIAKYLQMKYLIVTLVVLVISDGLVSSFLINHGLAREGNPFLQDVVGKDIFLILKATGAVVSAFILRDIYRHWPRVAVTASLCFVAIYSGIVLWNLCVLFIACL